MDRAYIRISHKVIKMHIYVWTLLSTYWYRGYHQQPEDPNEAAAAGVAAGGGLQEGQPLAQYLQPGGVRTVFYHRQMQSGKFSKKAQTNQINKEYAKVFSYINLILILMYSAINYQL